MNAPRPNPKRPFADLENKSMESLVTENKALDADDVADDVEDDTDGETPAEAPSADADAPVAAPAGDVTRVVMLHHHEYDGVALIPGKEYDLPSAYAAALMTGLRARTV